MDKPIPVNEENETKALIHELMEVVAKEAKRVFVSSAEDLVQQHYGSRVGQTLQIAVEDAAGTDLEWLQERLTDKVSTEIDRLRGFVESLVEERDAARAEIERLARQVDIQEAFKKIAQQERDQAEAQRNNAYRRGAEAMREAAADLFQGNTPGLAAMPTWSVFIRELPIPVPPQGEIQ